MTLAALFLAIGIILPSVVAPIPEIGKMLCPMHIPVLLCGLICGWKYGLLLGIVLPLTRTMMFGFPVLFPAAIAMCFELGIYGFVSGWIYSHSKWQCTRAVYKALIPAMLLGRAVWGIVSFILYGVSGGAFTMSMFIAGALTNAIPGILVQIILIPLIMAALNNAGLVRYSQPAGCEGI